MQSNQDDFLDIRNKPLYKINETEYLVLSKEFLVNTIYKTMYFSLNQFANSVGVSNFRSFWGDNISEKIFVYDILNRIFKKRHITYTGDEFGKFDGAPDYYIRNGNKIFLFESKDFLIKKEVKTSYDYKLCEKEIKKILFTQKDDTGKNNKGFFQLLNNIQRILDENFHLDNYHNVKKLVFYPIIIIHDSQYNLPGLNKLINNWSEEYIQEVVKEKKIDRHKIKPVTIIDIDSLTYYQELFINKSLVLEILIDGYHKSCIPKKRYKDEEHLRIDILKTADPFSKYVEKYVYDNNITFIKPKELNELSLELFKHT